MTASKPSKAAPALPAKKKAAKAATAQKPLRPSAKLDKLGIEWVCERIACAESMTSIAGSAGVSFGTLSAWLELVPERSARAREARRSVARFWDEKAEIEIASAGDPFELSKAKEMASHYRWRASKIAPKDYGDKLAVGGADDLPPIEMAKKLTDAERAVRLSRLLNDSPEVMAALVGALKGGKKA
jgi:hypothetical protein